MDVAYILLVIVIVSTVESCTEQPPLTSISPSTRSGRVRRWVADDCVVLDVRVNDPNNKYYTGVSLSGRNKCKEEVDLYLAIMSYETNYGVGSMWGSSQFVPKTTPERKNGRVQWTIEGGGWNRPVLPAGGSFKLDYGVSLNGKDSLEMNNFRILPPPLDNGHIDFNIFGNRRILRPITITVSPMDGQIGQPITVELADLSRDWTESIGDGALWHGKYKITVSTANMCVGAASPDELRVTGPAVEEVDINFECLSADLTMITVGVPSSPMPAVNSSSIVVQLLLADNRKIVRKSTVAWDNRAVFSGIGFEKYVIRVGNLTDGVDLAACDDIPIDLTGEEHIFSREIVYKLTPIPMISVDIFVDSDNETDLALTYTSSKFPSLVYSHEEHIPVGQSSFIVELPANDEFDMTVYVIDEEQSETLNPVVTPSDVIVTPQSQPLLPFVTHINIVQGPAMLPVLSIFWCGFSGSFCGQSTDDDVYNRTTHVILAFGNTKGDGSILVDEMPVQLIDKWHEDGKKVLISVGGQNGHWGPLFANPETFVESIAGIIESNNLDGVDLDIEGYSTPPAVVSATLKMLRERLGKDKLIVVSPENVTVFPVKHVRVPDAETGGGAYNYFVPILKESMEYIDLVQPQFYNNYYVNYGNGGTASSIVENYLGWVNQYPSYRFPDFEGVPPNKLIIGVPASTNAANSNFYCNGEVIREAIRLLKKEHKFKVRGVMMWDSMWDKRNGNEVSIAAADALGIK